MRKFMILAFVTLVTFATSCKAEKESKQMKEVMAVHDEVMPKMGQLGMENDSTDIGKQYKEARIDLQEANEAMMSWMQGFGDRFTPDEILNGKELPEQKQKWLDEEEEKVKAMREQINSSIEKAQGLLKKEN